MGFDYFIRRRLSAGLNGTFFYGRLRKLKTDDGSGSTTVTPGKTDRPGIQATLGGGLSDPSEILVNDWLRQDYRLSLQASQSCSIHIPAAGQWISWNIPVRIQAVQTDRLDRPAAP